LITVTVSLRVSAKYSVSLDIATPSSVESYSKSVVPLFGTVWSPTLYCWTRSQLAVFTASKAW
jgi:hypothetical protein